MAVLLLFLVLFSFILNNPVFGCTEGCKCTSEEVNCENKNLTTFPQLQTLPVTVNLINFGKNRIKDIWFGGNGMTSFPYVKELFLDFNELTRLPMPSKSLLSVLPELRNLSISNNEIQHIAEGAFLYLPELEYLSLNKNKISNILDYTFFKLGRLQSLELSGNRLTKVRSQWFQMLFSLKELDLSSNRISSFEPQEFKWPGSIMKLNLNSNKLLVLPPFPVKKCNHAGSCEATKVKLLNNNIYCGCRRPEHNISMLKMLLPLLYVCCVEDCPEKSAFRYKFNPFHVSSNYFEGPVCQKPSVEINANKRENVCQVKGEPKPEVSVSYGCLTQDKANRMEVMVSNGTTITCEATNIFGTSSQIFYLLDEPCEILNFTSSNLMIQHEITLPLWSVVILFLMSFSVTGIILASLLDHCIEKQIILREYMYVLE